MELSQNPKYFLNFFQSFSNLHKSEILWKKTWDSELICFSNDRLQNAGLLKCLKSLLSEHLWAVNLLKGQKDCLNLNSSIFVIYFDHSEIKSAKKIRFK